VTPLVEAVIFSDLKHVGSVAVAAESTSVFFFIGCNGGDRPTIQIHSSDRHDRSVKAWGRHTTPNTRREIGGEGEELRQAVTPGQQGTQIHTTGALTTHSRR
jgi:hypothetical protein